MTEIGEGDSTCCLSPQEGDKEGRTSVTADFSAVYSSENVVPCRDSSTNSSNRVFECIWEGRQHRQQGEEMAEGGYHGENVSTLPWKERRIRGERKHFVGGGFYKTKVCRFFDRGQCKYGSSCSYAHAQSEIRQALNLRKTRLCASFRRGQCNSADCSFAHGHAELRSTDNLYKTQLCLFWLAGRCR